MRYHVNGFTLLELLIGIMIVAILSLFAMVTYQVPQQKTQHQSAAIALLLLANALEEYFDDHLTYQGFNLNEMKMIKNSSYRFTFLFVGKNQFTLAATPKKINSSDQCGTFYLDQDGNKSISGEGTLEDCW